jgi:hypothetical protein
VQNTDASLWLLQFESGDAFLQMAAGERKEERHANEEKCQRKQHDELAVLKDLEPQLQRRHLDLQSRDGFGLWKHRIVPLSEPLWESATAAGIRIEYRPDFRICKLAKKRKTKLIALKDRGSTHICGVVSSDNLIEVLEALGGPMKRRTKRKVSKTKTAARRRAHGKGVYKVRGGWAVRSGRKRTRSRRR